MLSRLCTARKNEGGSASIEATISMVLFTFLIFAIYIIVCFCVVEAKVSYAISSTAREVSQYSYFYHAFGLDGLKSNIDTDSEKATNAYLEFSEAVSNVDVGSMASTGKAIASDPKGYLKSFVSLLASKAWDALTNLLIGTIAPGLTQKHFEGINGDANNYLTTLGVVDGFEGLDFSKSSIFADDTGKQIEIVVTYTLSLKYFIPNPIFHQEVIVTQRAVTDGWMGNK